MSTEPTTGATTGPTFIEAQQAMHEASRQRRRHQQACTGCEACDVDAEARKEARDD